MQNRTCSANGVSWRRHRGGGSAAATYNRRPNGSADLLGNEQVVRHGPKKFKNAINHVTSTLQIIRKRPFVRIFVDTNEGRMPWEHYKFYDEVWV